MCFIGGSKSKKEKNYLQIYQEINDVISVLDEKVDGVIERHENDFLAAYRVSGFIHLSFRDTCKGSRRISKSSRRSLRNKTIS